MSNSTSPVTSKATGRSRQKTASQVRRQKAREAQPGWDVKRRTMTSDGTLTLACEVGALRVDLRIGRRGAETAILRDPDALLEAESIASLITVRSGQVDHG